VFFDGGSRYGSFIMRKNYDYPKHTLYLVKKTVQIVSGEY